VLKLIEDVVLVDIEETNLLHSFLLAGDEANVRLVLWQRFVTKMIDFRKVIVLNLKFFLYFLMLVVEIQNTNFGVAITDKVFAISVED
jgi:hypothetical protein